MNVAHKQRGVAFITALVILAIAVVLATDRYWFTFIDGRRTANMLNAGQAYAYVLGAEDWVAHILRRDDATRDTIDDDWAVGPLVLPVEGGQITGEIKDSLARFNVNNLVNAQGETDQAWLARFRRLLVILELDPTLAERVADWIDSDIEPNGFNGAEDDFYLRKSPAYRTANRSLTSVSELRRVEGMTAETYEVLAPFLSALPENTPVNINFASREVLIAVGNSVSESDIDQIFAARESGQFESTESMSAVLSTLQGSFQSGTVAVNSSYFSLQTRVAVGSAAVTLYSTLHRDPQTGATLVLKRSASDY